MKVTNQGHINAHFVELISDMGNGLCSLWRVDSDPHQFRTRYGQFFNLNGCSNDINGVGVGHRLNTNGRLPPHRDNALPPHHLSLKAVPLKGNCRRNGLGHGLRNDCRLHHFLTSKVGGFESLGELRRLASGVELSNTMAFGRSACAASGAACS